MMPLAMLLVAGMAAASAEPLKLASIPTALPDDVREPLIRQRLEIVNVIAKYNDAIDAFNTRCSGVASTDSRYSACLNEMKDLQAAPPRIEALKQSLKDAVEAALRAAHLVSSITFSNVKIQGDVRFQDADGKPLDAARIAALDIPLGTKIVTGPTGSFTADAPGMHTLHVGGGADLTIDTVFVTPSSLSQLNLDLKRGFFRWVRKQEETFIRLRDSSRYRVRTPNISMTVRGTDVEVDVKPDGAGVIRLYGGDVQVLSRDSTKRITLKPGEMITVKSDGAISDPVAIPAGTRPPPREPTYSRRREP